MHPKVQCSAISNSQDREAPKCPWTGERIKKMWYLYTMEYYSTIKRNERVPFATTWMDLEKNILSQKEEDKHHMMSLTYGI